MRFEVDTCRVPICQHVSKLAACELCEGPRSCPVCSPRFVVPVSAVVAPPLTLLPCRSPPSPPTVSRPSLRLLRVLSLTRRPLVGLIVRNIINSMGIPLSTCRASAGPGSRPEAGAVAPAPTVHDYESPSETSDSNSSKALHHARPETPIVHTLVQHVR